MEPSSELDIKRILRLLYAKKALFLLAVVMVTTAMIILTYLWPKKYEAKSMIFIERNVLNELIKSVTVTPMFEEKIRALTIVMKSRSLILKVMSDLDFDINGKNEDEIEGMVKNFQDKTDIKVEVNPDSRRNTDLFIVSYTDSDPKLATNFVNTLVRRYIEQNLSTKREEAYGANRFLMEQIDSFKAKLARIEGEMARIQKNKGASEKTLSERGALLYEQLQALMKKKNELLVIYTESHPEVVKIETEIDMVKEQMKTVSPANAGGGEKVLMDLLRERETTKKIYEDLLSTLNKSEVSTQVEIQDKAGAFRILDPAIVPTKPVSPNIPRMIILAMFAGMAAGVGLIIVIDMTDTTVKSVDMLKKMGLPVLAVIPKLRTDKEISRIRKKNGLLYTFAGIYVAALLAIATMEAAGISPIDNFVQQARTEIKNSLNKSR